MASERRMRGRPSRRSVPFRRIPSRALSREIVDGTVNKFSTKVFVRPLSFIYTNTPPDCCLIMHFFLATATAIPHPLNTTHIHRVQSRRRIREKMNSNHRITVMVRSFGSVRTERTAIAYRMRGRLDTEGSSSRGVGRQVNVFEIGQPEVGKSKGYPKMSVVNFNTVSDSVPFPLRGWGRW